MSISRLRLGIWLLCLAVAACHGRTRIKAPARESSSGGAEPALKVMEAEQRQFLWEIEHHGNVLNRIGFPALAAALTQDDEKALSGMLASGFTGEIPQQPTEVLIHNEFVDVVRQTDAGKPPAKVDGA